MADLARQTADALKRAIDKHQKGDVKAAARLYKKVLRNHDGNFMANNYYGLILLSEGKYKKALQHFKISLENRPGWLEAHLNIARVALKTGDTGLAIQHGKKALEADPQNAQAYMYLGTASHAGGDPDKALEYFKKTIEINPSHAGAYNSIGGVYAEAQAYKKALPWFEKAVELEPDFALAWNNMGVALRTLNNLDRSLASYNKALSINPGYVSAISNKADLITDIGGSEQALPMYESIWESPDFMENMHTNYLMALHYAPDIDMNKIFKAQTKWGRRFADKKTPKLHKSGNINPPKSKSPLRIGLVSGNFHRHPVGYMIIAAMENIDAERFHLFYYSDTNPDKHDDITARLKATSRQWHETRYLPEARMLRTIEEDKIDMLIDLSGHSEGSRLVLFGHRPAPVQVEWVGGLFGTSGLRDMDWIIGDNVEIPEGDEKWYTEKVYRMPDDYICYDPPEYLPEVGPLPAIDKGYITFANFNNGPKTNSKGIGLWAGVLKSVPNSKLMLKNKVYDHDFVKEDFLEKIAAHGIEPERIIFRGGTSHKEHLSALNEADIALDPYPYTGGLTTCESLMMGVPTITWPGPHFAGKHSATHLTAAGYPDFIADGADDYVNRAVDLAGDLEELASYRAGMREKVLASPLCDGPRFARNFEQAVIYMIN
mgnify:CR=1 FL=1